MPNSNVIRTTELPTGNLKGHALRRVQKLNDTLRNTRRLVAKSGQNPQQSLALLVAETRVLVLRMGRYEFGQLANMHFHAVKNVETPGSHPQHESLSRIYRTWYCLTNSDGPHAPRATRTRKLLAEAAVKFLDILVPINDDYERALRSTVEGLYWKWTYQVGRDAFGKASMRTNRQRKPLTYGTLWQRHEVQMVPDFYEVRVIAQALEQDIKKAAEIWSKQKTQQLVDRGVAAPLVRLTVALQQMHVSLKMTAASIRKHTGVSLGAAQAIRNGRMIPYTEIQPVTRSVIPKRERHSFARAWKSAQHPDHEEFATVFRLICTTNGWNNHMIAKLLRVRAPELRDESAKSKRRTARSEPYRPAAEVRRMCQGNSFSAQVPAKAAIELIAADDGGINESGETQIEYLERLFLEGVDRQLRQKGSAALGSMIRKQRILCGVTVEQLAELSGENKDELLLIERGVQQILAATQKRLIRLTQQRPRRMVDEARKELVRLTSAPQTVVEAVTLLKERLGGYVPLSRLLHDAQDRRFSFTPDRLKRIAAGQEVPPLPALKSLVNRGGSEVVPELLRDWHLQMPRCLANHPKLHWSHPLARGFGIVVFEQCMSLYQFWKEHFEGDFGHTVLTRNFQQMNGKGYDIAWSTVSRYLNAAGVGIQAPRRVFWQRLFERKNEITQALRVANQTAVQKTVREILTRWRRNMRASGVDPALVEHRLGLMPEEHLGWDRVQHRDVVS